MDLPRNYWAVTTFIYMGEFSGCRNCGG